METNSGNVIKHLWDRPDHLATVELYSLGAATRELIKVDKSFVAAKVKEITNGDVKTQNGALFELFALNSFIRNSQVIPAKGNNPGYDGIVKLQNNKSFKLSIKNYSLSANHIDFLNRTRAAEDLAKELMNKYKCPPVETIINKKSGYPTSGDWEQLMNGMGVFMPICRISKAV